MADLTWQGKRLLTIAGNLHLIYNPPPPPPETPGIGEAVIETTFKVG